jgi:hypothetical protein
LAVGGAACSCHLLNQVEGHLWVYVRLGVNRIRPSRPQGHLNPVFAAARTANQLNAVQDRSRSQLLPEGEFQLCEVWKNFGDKVWVADLEMLSI